MANEGQMISMKLLIDKSNHKVLFAEAGKECVDFFFHILSLPLGSVVGFLTKTSMVGSLGILYGSLEDLSTDYLKDGLDKDCLLNPKTSASSSSEIHLLTINQAHNDSAPKTFYACINNRRDRNGYYYDAAHRYASDGVGATCPECNDKMDQELAYVAPPADVEAKVQKNVVGYVKGVVTYMIMDDMCVKPMSTISTIALINKLNLQDMGALEEKEVSLDINLGVALLKASLMSKTVLTDVFLGNKPGFKSLN